MKVKNTEIKIIKGDIAKLKVDAVVLATNSALTLSDSVGFGLRKKLGHKFEQAVWKNAPVSIGDAVAIKYKELKSKSLILTVPGDVPLLIENMLRRSCAKAFELAIQSKSQSVALGLMGFPVGDFPLVGAAKVMAQEALKCIRLNDKAPKEIIFCLPDQKTYSVFNKTIAAYINYMVFKMQEGPYSTVDAIIELPEGIILIERSNPPYGWALPGGFVDYGESLEDAVAREAKEETNMELENARQFHVYSDPTRDPRFHTIATAFVAKGKGKPQFGDDAKGLKIVRYEDLLKLDYAFDHKKIIEDYLKSRNKRA